MLLAPPRWLERCLQLLGRLTSSTFFLHFFLFCLAYKGQKAFRVSVGPMGPGEDRLLPGDCRRAGGDSARSVLVSDVSGRFRESGL